MKVKIKDNIERASADPFVCQVEGGWAMYVTGGEGVEAYACDTPMGEWEYKGIVCRIENRVAYWAPCLYYENGWYYIYFSCRGEGTGELMYVAKSQNPFGPFDEAKRLYECFSIDPHMVRTEEGLFLWYCMDNIDCERVGTRVYVQKFSDPMTPFGEAVEKIVPSFDEEIFMRDRMKAGQHWHTIEGPFYLQVDGWQYLMYSGACYQNETYHIGYSSAETDEADLRKVIFTKHTNNGKFDPLLIKDDIEEGMGHHSVIYYEGEYYAFYHGRDYNPNPQLNADKRTARFCRLHFKDGVITAERI